MFTTIFIFFSLIGVVYLLIETKDSKWIKLLMVLYSLVCGMVAYINWSENTAYEKIYKPESSVYKKTESIIEHKLSDFIRNTNSKLGSSIQSTCNITLSTEPPKFEKTFLGRAVRYVNSGLKDILSGRDPSFFIVKTSYDYECTLSFNGTVKKSTGTEFLKIMYYNSREFSGSKYALKTEGAKEWVDF